MHLSMRVPWQDTNWDGRVCADPAGNSSCIHLKNIGAQRDDAYEVAHSGESLASLDVRRLPCLSERASFMSATGYTIDKEHAFRFSPALRDHLLPTQVAVPGYAFEAIPYRWLNRGELRDSVGDERVPGFDEDAERLALDAMSWKAQTWVMHADNQRAVIDEFFAPVVPDDSLVFIYLKHSPLQEDRTDRLLVGAARVTEVRKPGLWNTVGMPPYPLSMWETIVCHSLRPEMTDGILLPYQEIARLAENGIDVSGVLAWAPEGRTNEFSYVTEHVSDDAAVEALELIDRAARALPEIGVAVPDAALEWIAKQTARLWKHRGPAPGLASVLSYMGMQRPYLAARTLHDALPAGSDPWVLLEQGFADRTALPEPVRPLATASMAKTWAKMDPLRRTGLKVLSSFDISADQVRALMEGETEVPMSSLKQLTRNPYWAVICTFSSEVHVPFDAVDRAMFPPEDVTWQSPAAVACPMEHDSRERVQAMLVEVLERAGTQGDTLLPVDECLERGNAMELTRQPTLTHDLLIGVDLDPQTLANSEAWEPVIEGELADGSDALKLRRYWDTAEVIRDWVDELRARESLGTVNNARGAIDTAIASDNDEPDQLDADEEAARSEKAAGLSVLYESSIAVVVGAAGTGKTTLLRALVDQLPNESLLLLAPTGKARVQLASKVGRDASTIAGFLLKTQRYDGRTGRYRVRRDAAKQVDADLVVIDEASMLTEEMLAATLDAFRSIRRLVLVGDPRQLPPIGEGRPFVDLVNDLRPAAFQTDIRVAPRYVELTIPRRQTAEGVERHDLALASWFGSDTLAPGADLVWNQLRTTPDLGTIRYEQWGERTGAQALRSVLAEELDLPADGEDAVAAFALSYGGTQYKQWINWTIGAAKAAERWQILSPTRSRGFGSTEINREIKRRYRGADLNKAMVEPWRLRVPKPSGPEQILLGDKVMQTVNDRVVLDGGQRGYVANGEIGVVVGQVGKSDKLPQKVEFISQQGQVYVYWPVDDDDVPLELAWAITVHKSQGSEFGTTILVIPARSGISRELMYTAMTRQQRRVVVVHEGTLDDLRELSHPWRSETARRITDLFQAPDVLVRERDGESHRFDGNLVHVTATGVFVRSKNEVIVAGILEELAPGKWEYELPLAGSDGRELHPDFTIVRRDGSRVYWEHLGMMSDPRYRRNWQLKANWYAKMGILPFADGGGPKGTLLTTDDSNGVDAKAWKELAEEALGGPPVARSAKQPPRRPGRPGAV